LAVRKQIAGAKLDFSAIAKGYGVDALGELVEKAGVKNYLVEIGGEVRARGDRPGGQGWHVGIEQPSEDALAPTRLERVILLKDAALATSGNYRNFRVENGKKAAHIVNPRTGYPALSPLLSVSVWAKDTMTADAYATALIVMGLDEGLRFVEAREGLEAYFIAKDDAGNLIEKWSSGFPKE
jgi:thiamine biosynthesis lipoprotein